MTKIQQGAIQNAKRILEAYGYTVRFEPFVCKCGRRFQTEPALKNHITSGLARLFGVDVHANVTPEKWGLK